MSEPTAEQLMALADGELDADTSRELRATIAADPKLASQYQVFVETKEPITELFASRAQDDLPEQLVALVRDYELGARRHDAVSPRKMSQGFGLGRLLGRFADAVFSPQVALAGIAAAFALGLAIGTTLPSDPVASRTGGQLTGWHAASSGLGAVLESTPSGKRIDIGQADSGGVAFVGVLSFLSKAGQFCRQYRLEQTGGGAQLGVACRRSDGTGWKDAIRVSAAATGTVKPAFSVADRQVDQTIDRLIDGDVLAGKSEARLIAGSWRTR